MALIIQSNSFLSNYQVLPSNNDPRIIAGLFVNAVEVQGHAPKLLRTDCGTENGIAAAAQAFFHQDENSHAYGKSVSNQRIEAFWSKLRPVLDGWIHHFKTMQHANLFQPGNQAHIYSMRIAFAKQISDILKSYLVYWNTHTIRQSADAPGGIPDTLFYLCSHHYGATVDQHALALAKESCTFNTTVTGDQDIDDYFEWIFERFQLVPPTDKQSATDLFMSLVARVEM